MCGMSFSITVTVTDGTPLTRTQGQVPDGQYTVTGADSQGWSELGIARDDADGRRVASAIVRAASRS